MNTFNSRIREMQIERQKKELDHLKREERNGVYIYTRFCIWCNVYKNGQGKHDYKLFEEYVKKNNIVANWWQRKRIYENYFGFEFEFEDNKWIKVKKGGLA